MGQSNTHYDHLPTGEHSVLPVDGHSYQPKTLEYSLLITESTADTELIISQRHNLQAIYPLVAKFYSDGYTLNQLKRIPCVKYDNKTLFQVILSRPVGAGRPNANEKRQLHVKRSFVTTEHSNSTITTQVTELWRDIQEEACRGARLVSIEPTIPAAHHQVQEVDVFFNLPSRTNRSFYIYQAISVPVIWQRDAQHATEHALECNWFENFTTFLSEGWKLVEILFDSSVRHRVTVPSRTLTMNSVWVFEKEAEFENVSSPKWEGVIVRYLHKSITRFEDFRECNAKTSWDKVIHTMGSRGWELACIVSTPPSIQKGSMVTSIHCKVLMFFQRPFTGNKPLPRQNSSSQGVALSPIRVEGFPDWSIIGESHMEGGRPVCLPPYSERGVDVGPLESSPDRPQPVPVVPPEPPPTYAETVANDVTLLFNTSMPEASPPLSPTQMTTPSQLLSSSSSPEHLRPSRIPVSQMPPRDSIHDVFFDDTHIPSTAETLSSRGTTRSAGSETPGTSSDSNSAPDFSNRGTRNTTQTTGARSDTNSDRVSRTRARDRAKPSGPESRTPGGLEAVTGTSDRLRPSGSQSRPSGGSNEPREDRDARGRKPSGGQSNQRQQQQHPEQRIREASAYAGNKQREPRASSGTRKGNPSHRQNKQQRSKSASRSESREHKQEDGRGKKSASSPHTSDLEARGRPPPKPPRASKNIPTSRADGSSSVPHRARMKQQGTGKRRPDEAQPPTLVANTSPANSGEYKMPREAAATQQSQATSVPAPTSRTGFISQVRQEERGNKIPGHWIPVAQPPRDATVAYAASNTHRKPNESAVIQEKQATDFQTPVRPPHSDQDSQTFTGRGLGNHGFGKQIEPKRITEMESENVTDPAEFNALGVTTKPTGSYQNRETNPQVPQPLPRNIADGSDQSSTVNSRGGPEIPHRGGPVLVAPESESLPAGSTAHLEVADTQAMHKSQPSDYQGPVPLPRKNTAAPEGRGRLEPSRRNYDVPRSIPFAQRSKTAGTPSTQIPRKQVEPPQESRTTKVRAPPPRPPKSYLTAKGHVAKSNNLLSTAAIPYNKQDLSVGFAGTGQREGVAKLRDSSGVEQRGEYAQMMKRLSPTPRAPNSDPLSSLDRLQREWEENKSRTNLRKMTGDPARGYSNRAGSHSQGVNSGSRAGLSAAERLQVTSVRPPIATERSNTDQGREGVRRYAEQAWKKGVQFDPSLVQMRRDRDYERISGVAKENTGLQKRSRDDLNVGQSDRMKGMDDTRVVRARLTEITNVSPRGSDASDEPPPIPPRRKRSSQGLVGVDKTLSDPPGQGSGSSWNEPQDALDKTPDGTAHRIGQAKEVAPRERSIPTYKQALERKIRLEPEAGETDVNYKSPRPPRKPVEQSRPQELPDVIRHKQEDGSDSFWLIQDTDSDEVFISSQVRPESQSKMRAAEPPSLRDRCGAAESRPRRQDLQEPESSGSRYSPKGTERGNRRDAPQPGMKIELSEADRRSLDSLQSFIVDKQKRPPEYDAALARRFGAPDPMRQAPGTAPDLLENPSSLGHMSQGRVNHRDDPSWDHQTGLQRANSGSNPSKPPLPSYQQVIGSRSGAIPKLKMSETHHQSSSESSTHRPERDQIYQHSTNSKGHHDGGPPTVTSRGPEPLSGPRSNQGLGNSQSRQPTHHSEGHATQASGSLYLRDDSSSKVSDSPVGSMDSFDLISQWSQDEVEPPPSRLTKDLRVKREPGQSSSGGSSDRESGDYALSNHSGKPGKYESANPTGCGKSGGHREVSTRSPKVSKRWNIGEAGDYGVRDMSRSTSGEQYAPPQSQRLRQRHVYVSKEIL